MSYIHRFIKDNNTPSPVWYLFSLFISDYDKQNSTAWQKQVKQKNDEYHRKIILKQGRCDFDKPPLGLTSEELMVLYNYYYFPMHFQSSYDIFNILFKELKDLDKQTFFIHDFGCGTLSSTFAFGASYQNNVEVTETNYEYGLLDHHKLHFYFQKHTTEEVRNVDEVLYSIRCDGVSSALIGVNSDYRIGRFKLPSKINGYYLQDSSSAIEKYIIKELINRRLLDYWDTSFFFNSASSTESYFYFNTPADKFYIGNLDLEPLLSFAKNQNISLPEICVILNFSYVLASESIKPQEIIQLINEYKNTNCKLILINQNPDLDSLNLSWSKITNLIKYKQSIKGLQPILHFNSKSKVRYEIVIIN